MSEILESFDGELRTSNVGILFNIYREEKRKSNNS